jgi:hypothetical protein
MFRLEQLMRSGSVKPQTFKEALVYRHWLRERNARIYETIIPVIAGVDKTKASELMTEYYELLYPTKEREKFNGVEKKVALSDWISSGEFKFSEHDGDPSEVLPPDWVKAAYSRPESESTPSEWRGFLKAKYRRGRREDKI